MGTYRSLELILRDILEVVKPSSDDWAVRFHIIDELRAVVQAVESLKGATVEPFGSFVSDLFTRWGDLDISIELPNGIHISVAGRKQKQSLLGDVLRALRKRGAWRRLQFISHARVPILKFESVHKNISCDISINNLAGQMKSKFLFWINSIDGRFREMVLLVKEWAKANSINDSKSGTLNSYSLSLLIIFHFQTCDPAILPPLKEIYPGNMVNDLIGVRSDAEEHIKRACEANIKRFTSDRSRRINQSSLKDLFVSFFEKFRDINIKASEQGLSLHNAQWEDLEQNNIWLPKTYALFVEDPFEQPVNTARSVSSRQLIRISEAFQRTHQMLTSSNQPPGSIAASLVRQEALYMMGQKLAGNPSSNGGSYFGNHGQMLAGNPSSNGRSYLGSRGQMLAGNPSSNGRSYLGSRGQMLPGNPNSNGGSYLGSHGQMLPGNPSSNGGSYLGSHGQIQAGNPSSNGGSYTLGRHVQFNGGNPNNKDVSLRDQGNPSTNDRTYMRPQPKRNIHSNGYGQFRPEPQAPNIGHASQQVKPPQKQVQATRVDKPPNPVVTQGPPQASHDQVQKTWRPKSEK